MPCGLILTRLETLDQFERGHGKEAGHALVHEVARTLKDMMRRSDNFQEAEKVFRGGGAEPAAADAAAAATA